MATPEAPSPVSCVAITAGGLAFRSITLTMLCGAVFFLSAGSSLVAAVTSANDSSGAMATLCGGPTRLVGILISATSLGGVVGQIIDRHVVGDRIVRDGVDTVDQHALAVIGRNGEVGRCLGCHRVQQQAGRQADPVAM